MDKLIKGCLRTFLIQKVNVHKMDEVLGIQRLRTFLIQKVNVLKKMFRSFDKAVLEPS